MSTIKGRLSRIKSLGLVKASEISGGPRERAASGERESFLPGWEKIAAHTFTRTIATGFGLAEDDDYSFESAHFANQNLRRKKGLAPELSFIVPFDRLSFFDLETTGLSGGTGTVAFLAAIGFFEGRDFLITQVFMDDFPGEPSFLDFTVKLLAERPHLVTYNGAAFDLPLLRTRCIMNAIPVPELRHIDALQTSRRFWRRTMGSCSLQALEAGVLGEEREDDVPGFLIPRLWLDYSKSGRAPGKEALVAMGKVAYHNALDVRSLARLFLKMEGIMKEPLSRWACERVYASHIALELIAAERKEEGYRLLEDAGSSDDRQALYILARLYRRSRDLDAYTKVVQTLDDECIESCIEKAKYHEHLKKDPVAALVFAEKALTLLESAEEKERLKIRLKEALEKRKTRLIRKRGK